MICLLTASIPPVTSLWYLRMSASRSNVKQLPFCCCLPNRVFRPVGLLNIFLLLSLQMRRVKKHSLPLSVPVLVRSLPSRPNILPPPPFLVLPLLLSADRTQRRVDPLQSPAIRTLRPPTSDLLSPLRPESNLLPFPGPGPDTKQEGEEEDRQQDGGLHVGD